MCKFPIDPSIMIGAPVYYNSGLGLDTDTEHYKVSHCGVLEGIGTYGIESHFRVQRSGKKRPSCPAWYVQEAKSLLVFYV